MSLIANWRYNKIRWWIVGLLFFVTLINYVHRQTLSVLSPTLRTELRLSEADYANIVSAFLLSYLIMYTVSGRLIDRIGVRLGLVLCVAWWSVAAMLTGVAQGVWSLMGLQFLLGMGQPGVFPGGVKACAEWFPKKMRALPTGIFSSGVSIGAIIVVPLVAWITLQLGWRAAFILPGAVGLFWIPLWWAIYRSPSQHPSLRPEERTMLEEELPSGGRKSWRELLSQRKVWGLVLPRLASDPVWYFYLFWLPDYFQRERHLSLAEIGIYGWIPFLFADLGSILGGMASDWFIRRGWPAARARFVVLGVVGLLAPFGIVVGFVQSTAAAIAITCLITFLCQAWSTNIATLNADLCGRDDTGTVMGLMGTVGGIGGMLFAQVVGFSISRFGYSSAFVLAALLLPVAAIVLFLILRPWLRNQSPVTLRQELTTSKALDL
jgi:ACS family hexuronate transporter-like MFS transporter